MDNSGSGIPLRPFLVPASGSEKQTGRQRLAGWTWRGGWLSGSISPACSAVRHKEGALSSGGLEGWGLERDKG